MAVDVENVSSTEEGYAAPSLDSGEEKRKSDLRHLALDHATGGR